MWKTIPCTCILLCFTSCTSNQSNCSEDGPENCAFPGGRPCSWNNSNDVIFKPNWFALFQAYASEGSLTSRKACSTKGATHCLTFQYRADSMNGTELSVFVKEVGSRKPQVWGVTSGSPGWNNAQVPIEANSTFSVIIRSKKIGESKNDIHIKQLEYVQDDCIILPEEAIPTEMTSSVTMLASIKSTRTTPLSPPSGISQIKEATTEITKVITTSETPLSLSSASHIRVTTESGSETSSNNLGMIIGITVSVIIALALACLIVLYLHRKQKGDWKLCFKDRKQNKDQQRHSSPDCDLRTIFQYDADYAEIHDANPNAVNRMMATPSSARSPGHYCNVMKREDGHQLGNPVASHGLCAQNQHNNGKPFVLPQTSSENPYENNDVTEISISQQAMPRDVYNTLNPNKKANQSKHGAGSTSVSRSSIRSPLPSNYSLARPMGYEEAGVYHSLENDVVNQEQEAADTVYHILEEDPELNDKENEDTPELYHILEDDPTLSTSGQPVCHTLKGGIKQNKENKRQQHGQPMITSREKEDEYNSLDFTGKGAGGETTDSDSDTVYNHLGETAEGVYNEVDREKRAVVIDSEYAHIK